MTATPRFATPRDVSRATLGDRAGAFVTVATGRRPLPWQLSTLRVGLELAPGGVGYAYRTVIVVVPRRAGKTVIGLATGLTHMDHLADCHAWYTAQSQNDAGKTFRKEWVPMVGNTDLRRAFKLRRAAGSQAVESRTSTAALELFAPTRTGLHGQAADLAMVDEAWAFSDEAGAEVRAAYGPAQATRPWAQEWIFSAGGTEESEWLDGWMTLGRAGAPGVAYFEYSADAEAADYDPGNPAVWARTHPAVGYTIASLEHEWTTRTSVADFERNYLNVWPRPSELTGGGLDLNAWALATDHESAPAWDAPLGLAVDVTPERDWAAMAAAGRRTDGRVHLELGRSEAGTGWVVEQAQKMLATTPARALTLNSHGPAAALLPDLYAAGVPVDPVDAGDYANAVGAWYDDLVATPPRLAHRGQEALTAAVTAARLHPRGDVFVWRRRNGNVAPLVAVTLARWAAVTAATPAIW